MTLKFVDGVLRGWWWHNRIVDGTAPSACWQEDSKAEEPALPTLRVLHSFHFRVHCTIFVNLFSSVILSTFYLVIDRLPPRHFTFLLLFKGPDWTISRTTHAWLIAWCISSLPVPWRWWFIGTGILPYSMVFNFGLAHQLYKPPFPTDLTPPPYG